MANYRVPGVEIKEIPPVATAIESTGIDVGALVGRTYKGPTNQRVLVRDEKAFVGLFGAPRVGGATYEYPLYAALKFLKASNSLYFVRQAGSADKVGAVAFEDSRTAESITLDEAPAEGITSVEGFENGNSLTNYYPAVNYTKENAGELVFTALGASDLNSLIGVAIVTDADGISGRYGYDWGTTLPQTASDGTPVDYFRVNVYTRGINETIEDVKWEGDEEDESFNPVASITPVESFVVSNNPNAVDDLGKSLFIEDVINGKSRYIFASCGEDYSILPSEPFEEGSIIQIVPLGEGVYDIKTSPTQAWGEFFGNKNEVSAQIFISTRDEEANVVANIVNSRKDAIAVIQIGDPTLSVVDENTIADEVPSSTNTSYCVRYVGGDLHYDVYTNKNVYLPRSIAGAYCIANTPRPWDAPAGTTRGATGEIRSYKRFRDEDIGVLFGLNLNTTKYIRGIGDFIWGDKTGHPRNDALSSIGARRTLNMVESTLEADLPSYIYENNTPMLRTRVQSNIKQYLDRLYSEGAFKYEPIVVCDSFNNDDTLDMFTLNIDIAIVPVSSIRYINVTVSVNEAGDVAFAYSA